MQATKKSPWESAASGPGRIPESRWSEYVFGELHRLRAQGIALRAAGADER